ncbi:MAG: hypothetical protein DI598_06580 [Pseudopedobacter saltans]|uniref:Cell division protein FtsQ n=1 Tax=Pseudopedobacter saltans TaxID=151895 RepID=A0A2W5H853_9SPHI|nr:MAG: hypothetical protein DI598_06580 [Pseudopedobacter saltans]
MKRKLIFLLWVLLGCGLITLLVAARGARKNAVCPDFKISIEGKNNQIFIDEKEIVSIAKENGVGKGIPAKDINLQNIENALKANPWISHAKMYFDDENNLRASIWESEPIARIFTLEGSSFYVDSATRILPLHPAVIARLPVFTSFTSTKAKLSKPDSLLLVDVKNVAEFIVVDSFWNAFVSEVNIRPDRTFEIVPTLGNTIITLGRGDSLQEKFDRLYSFYKQVWTKTGFNRYEKLDVRCYNQVIATRRGGMAYQLKDTATINAQSNSRWNVKQLEQSGIINADSTNKKDVKRTTVKPVTNNNKKQRRN